MMFPRFANNASSGISACFGHRISVTMHVVALVFLIQCNAASANSLAPAAIPVSGSSVSVRGGGHQQALRGVQRKLLLGVPHAVRGTRWLLGLGQVQAIASRAGSKGRNLPTPPPAGALPPVPKKLLVGDLRSGGLPVLPPMTGPPPPPGPDPPVPPVPLPSMNEVGVKTLSTLPIPMSKADETHEYDFYGNLVAVKNVTTASQSKKAAGGWRAWAGVG
mmetsp:Transcript_57107/g.107647  ORF Transcript_57107/g.107647 Transcript_57107/m.107647 type:complete len:219 (+) Transcript_57107:139-795(+)